MADLPVQLNHTAENITADAAGYFRALMRSAHAAGLLFDADILSIEEQLWLLTGRQVGRYTLGDSSSVPAETAQELLASVCYSIGACLKLSGGEAEAVGRLKTLPPEKLFQMGQEALSLSVAKGKELLAKLVRGRVAAGNLSYNDTLDKALPGFFTSYDPRFFAHETACDIDYQLCIPVEGLSGIEFINEYMRRLHMENAFLSRFPPENIDKLLRGLYREHNELLINLFEPVYANAMGLTLLHKDTAELNIPEKEKDILLGMLKKHTPTAIDEMMAEAGDRLCAKLDIADAGLKAYLHEAQKGFACRLTQQLAPGDMGALFGSFKEPAETVSRMVYRDGPRMSDEALRALIGEMSGGSTGRKIGMLKRHVCSLDDWMEVVNACFTGGECPEAFKLLSGPELAVLIKKLYLKKGDAIVIRSQNEDWENALLDYVNRMDRP